MNVACVNCGEPAAGKMFAERAVCAECYAACREIEATGDRIEHEALLAQDRLIYGRSFEMTDIEGKKYRLNPRRVTIDAEPVVAAYSHRTSVEVSTPTVLMEEPWDGTLYICYVCFRNTPRSTDIKTTLYRRSGRCTAGHKLFPASAELQNNFQDDKE